MYDAQTQVFQRAFELGRPPHAWIFRGPSSTVLDWALKQAASLLASACLPYDETLSLIHAKNHPSFKHIFITQKTQISIDDIRPLDSFISHHAEDDAKRIIFLDSLKDMTLAAQNALLKKLEEPKGNTFFFLLAPIGTQILPTIKSRCRVLNFNRILTEEDESLSPLVHQYLEMAQTFLSLRTDYTAFLNFSTLASKTDEDFKAALLAIDHILTKHLRERIAPPSSQELRVLEKIFSLVKLEESMHVDRRHLLACILFNLEEINLPK